jgi:hypothetical protein
MKHFLKKKFFQGAGKKPKIPKPKPAILRPPNLGKYQILNSFSVVEIIDLISDGPIGGFVNAIGQVVKDGNILQALYLNNTPVMTTAKITSIEVGGQLGGADLSDKFNLLGDYFYQKETLTTQAAFIVKKVGQKSIIPNTTLQNQITFISGPIKVRNPGNPIDIKQSGLVAWGGFLSSSKQPFLEIIEKVTGKKTVTTFASIKTFNALTNNNVKWGATQADWKKINDSIFEFKDTWRLDVGSKTKISESQFKNFKNELNTNLTSSSKEQKHFINLAIQDLNYIDTLYEQNALFIDQGFNRGINGYCSVVLGTKNAPFQIKQAAGKSIYQKNDNNEFILDENGNKIIDDFFYYLENFEIGGVRTFPAIVPIIETSEQGDEIFTGNFYGVMVINLSLFLKLGKEVFPWSESGYGKAQIWYPYLYFSEEIGFFAQRNCSLKMIRGEEPIRQNFSSKYNFSNVSLEYRNGEERQNPLDGFKQTYIDYDYNAELYGPFSKDLGVVERIGKVDNDNSAANPNVLGNPNSSVDLREGRNYSNWNDINKFKELPGLFTHTIENPNVIAVSFSLAINNLYDTIDKDEGTKDADRKIGERRPSIVRIRVETGEIGKPDPFLTKRYTITALVEGLMVIDFGCPDLAGKSDKFTAVRDTSNQNNKYNQSSLSVPFELPTLDPNADTTRIKRYIKVYKESAETNSVLIEKDITLYKVTEIINSKLSYPFSAIAGIKLDARTFESIPERSYDCRLKLIKIPENYFPLKNTNTEEDKRYYSTTDEYNNTSKINKLVYNGDWDGDFKLGWTDNPAWILYDLLTNKRYGLGAYLDEDQINKWELYKIGRFCDAVDENGYFIGVPDGIGGLEPRYSCNVLIKDATKVYDSIVSITNLFRGMCYFSNSEVHFLDDRPRNPIMAFSNINVKDGIFNYSNIRKDQQYNTIEVSYLDRFENFQVKVEVVEDEQDIRKRGVFKSRIETFGVTSRAMARRIGQHMIYQTIKENQALEFVAGLEALLCRPGDLITVEDDLKTRASNFGRILNKDNNKKSLILDNQYLPDDYDNKITVYTPTGYTTNAEFSDLAELSRSRLPYFTVKTGLLDASDNILSGIYYFNKYDEFIDSENQTVLNYPLYTGKHISGHNLYCYYNTGASGFVFATGLPYQNNNLYDKVITNTGVDQILDIIATFESGNEFLTTGFRYNSTLSNKKGTPSGSFVKKLSSDFSGEYKGILPSEINTVNYPQITNYRITGFDNSVNNNYGCEVFLDQTDININLMPFIKEASPYKIARKNAEDQIYKVLAIKEENQNEYVVVASKYNTGKFVEIENFIMEDFLPNTFYSGPTTVNNLSFKQLNSPKIKSFTTGVAGSEPNVLGFVLSGSWEPVDNALVYRYEISNEIFQLSLTGETNSTNIVTDRLQNLGNWKLNVYAANDQNAYSINSLTSTTGIFVAFSNPGVIQYPKAAILNFTIT